MRAKPPFPRLNRAHPLAKGLVGAWAFHEGAGLTLTDLSGHRNHGTLVDGPTWSPGRAGYALKFNGSTQYVARTTTSGDSLDLRSSPLSISAWVRPLGFGGNNYIVSKNAAAGFSDQQYSLATSTNDLVLTVGGSGVAANYNNAPAWELGQWHHVVGTWDETRAKIYFNGAEIDDVALTPSSLARNNFSIGRRSNSADGTVSSFLWDGSLDDVCLYNRALSAREVRELYHDPWGVYRHTRNEALWVPDTIDLPLPGVGNARRVRVRTDADGNATAFTGPVHGRVRKIRYVKQDFEDGVDFTITTEKTEQELWVEEDVNEDALVAPRQPTHGTDGTPALYAAEGQPVLDFVWAVRERLKIEVENGGANRSGEFLIQVR